MKIRYLGVQIGPGGYMANDVEATVQAIGSDVKIHAAVAGSHVSMELTQAQALELARRLTALTLPHPAAAAEPRDDQ